MLRILRQPNFAKLWFGGLISMTGDWILMVGLPFEIYRRTGSTLATGAMVLAFLIPSILLGSVAGVFVDRWDRQRLMVVIDLVLAVVVLPLLAIDALGIWIAYVVLFVASCLDLLFSPAEGALLPNLLENAGRRPGHRQRAERHEQPPGTADRAGRGRHHRGDRRPGGGDGH